MNYRLSRHAREEMIRRGISDDKIEQAMRFPQQIVEEDAGRKAYQSQLEFDGKMFLLRLIVVDSIDPAVIVTLYRTSKITKYWQDQNEEQP